MNAESLPGELGSDLITLKTRADTLLDAAIAIGEAKARSEIFELITQLIAEKERAGDEIAVQVLTWMWFELSERYPIY